MQRRRLGHTTRNLFGANQPRAALNQDMYEKAQGLYDLTPSGDVAMRDFPGGRGRVQKSNPDPINLDDETFLRNVTGTPALRKVPSAEDLKKVDEQFLDRVIKKPPVVPGRLSRKKVAAKIEITDIGAEDDDPPQIDSQRKPSKKPTQTKPVESKITPQRSQKKPPKPAPSDNKKETPKTRSRSNSKVTPKTTPKTTPKMPPKPPQKRDRKVDNVTPLSSRRSQRKRPLSDIEDFEEIEKSSSSEGNENEDAAFLKKYLPKSGKKTRKRSPKATKTPASGAKKGRFGSSRVPTANKNFPAKVPSPSPEKLSPPSQRPSQTQTQSGRGRGRKRIPVKQRSPTPPPPPDSDLKRVQVTKDDYTQYFTQRFVLCCYSFTQM